MNKKTKLLHLIKLLLIIILSWLLTTQLILTYIAIVKWQDFSWMFQYVLQYVLQSYVIISLLLILIIKSKRFKIIDITILIVFVLVYSVYRFAYLPIIDQQDKLQSCYNKANSLEAGSIEKKREYEMCEKQFSINFFLLGNSN